MPRRPTLLTGLAAAVALGVAAPAALAGPDRSAAERPPAHAAAKAAAAERAALAAERRAARAERRAARRAGVNVRVRACVIADAAQAGRAEDLVTSAGLRVLAANAHARRAGLRRGTEFTAVLDGTSIRLVGAARRQDGTRVRLPRLGTFDDLDRGDVVTLGTRVSRTPKGQPVMQWDAFGAWRAAADRGPVRPRICPDPPAEPVPAA